MILLVSRGAQADTQKTGKEAINAGFVLNKMEPGKQVAYVTGVIEGLAVSRFLRDRPDVTGMKCIYDWYDKISVEKVDAWFARYPERPVGVILHLLIKKKCGE